MLPALAIQAYNEIAGRQNREAEVRDDALRLALFGAGELDRIVENARTVLAAVANLPAVRNLDAAGCNIFVSSLQRDFPQYIGIGAIDLKGHPFCANIAIPADGNASDREFYRTARDTGQFTTGEYIVGRLVNRAVLPFGLPFFDDSGHIAGVVYASLDLEWLARYFAEPRPLGGKSTLLIADRYATILARVPNNSNYAGKKLAAEYNSQVFAKEPGTVEIIGIDGVRRILGYVPVNSSPATGLYVGVGLTEADAFAGIDDATKFGFLLIGVGLATGLAVAWLGGHYFISRPITRLALAAAQWGSGNFAARTGLARGRSELTQLGNTFDAMAEQLLRQQRENATLLARPSKTGSQSAPRCSRRPTASCAARCSAASRPRTRCAMCRRSRRSAS